MSNPEIESRISPWEATLWGRWVLTGLLGGAAGGAVVAALAGAAFSTQWFTVSGFVLVATLVAVVAQSLVLRWQVAWAGRWPAASLAGWLLGAAAGAGVGAIMGLFLDVGVFPPTPGLVGVWAIGGAVVGTAAMQTLVLRREAARPGWWSVASVLPWAVAGALAWGQFLMVPAAVGQVVAGAASAGVAGAITGIALIWLLRPPAAEPTGHPRPVRVVLRFRSLAALVKSLDVRFGLEWLLVSALGVLGGALAGGIVGGVVGIPVALAVGGAWAGLWVPALAVLGAGVGAGIGVGVAQSDVLLDRLTYGRRWWVLAHTLGWAAGVGAGLAAATGADVPWTWRFALAVGLAVGFAAAGLVGGTLQWLILRGQVPRAAWWVVASTIGYALGGALAVGAASGSVSGFWLAIPPLVLVTTGAAMGGILRHRVPVREAPAPSRSGPTPRTSTCPHCQEINDVSARVCASCSRDLPARPRQRPAD